MNLHHPMGCDCYECVCDRHPIKQEPPPYPEEEPMPPDPTEPCQPCRVCRKPWDGESPKTTYTNETWAHDDCLPTPTPLAEAELNRLADLEAKATGAPWIAEEGNGLTAIAPDGRRVIDGDMPAADDVGFANTDLCIALRNAAPALLAAARENAGLREKARCFDEAVAFDCTRETILRLTTERDAALARVAELERKCKLAVEFIEDSSEADCAYPSDPCLRVHISELGHGMCDGCKARRALGYINAPAVFPPGPKPCPPNCDEEGHECVPPPNPKWVRCPAGCSEGWLMVYGYPASVCGKCERGGRPGWVKETPQ